VRHDSDALPNEFISRTAPPIRHIASLSRAVRIGTNAVIIGLWLWLYRPVFNYLTIIFSREDFRTSQLVLIAVIVLIAIRARKERLHLRIDAPPQLHYPALALALGGSALYLAVERFLDINTLSASLFGLASYGLLGLWMEPRRWRQGLPAALLLIGALPFGEHMQTFVGYPMRILTAALVRDGLAAAGASSVSIDTILVLENGVSHIDLPCSGVKSLWAGLLFLTAATWIDRRPFNLRWLLIAFIFAGLLFAANLARVGVLVVVGQVAGWRLIAEMLHVPLGVLGFAAVCVLAVILLRMGRPNRPDVAWAWGSSQGGEPIPHAEVSGLGAIGGRSGEPVQLSSEDPVLTHPSWLAPALATAILVMAFAYTPRPHTGLTQTPPAWEFPAELRTEPMPLKPDEIDWLTRGGAESADRRRFEWRGITGSMMLITSQTWRAHHRPERCFEVYGLSLDDSHTYLITREFPLRFVSLSYGNSRGPLSATYWFQSVDRTTDDYATRIWADLAPERDQWVLVTILFDGVHDPSTADLQAFYSALHAGVAHSLEGGSR
jgi:exosortase/archaeosortase family protein